MPTTAMMWEIVRFAGGRTIKFLIAFVLVFTTASQAKSCDVSLSDVPTIGFLRTLHLVITVNRSGDGTEFLHQFHQKHGEVFRLTFRPPMDGLAKLMSQAPDSTRIGRWGRRILALPKYLSFVNDIATMKEILKNTTDAGRSYQGLEPLLGSESLFLSDSAKPEEHESWLVAFKAIAQFFKPVSVAKQTLELKSAIRKNLYEYATTHTKNIDLGDFSFYLAFTTATRFMYAYTPSISDVEEARTGFKDIFNSSPVELKDKGQHLDNIYERINAKVAPSASSLFQALRTVQIDKGLSEDWLKAQVKTLLFASFETTQSLIAALLYRASLNPLESDHLRDVYIAEPSDQPTYQIPEFAKFINETLRLNPPVPIVPRHVINDFVAGGYQFHAGEELQLNIYSSQLSHSRWGSHSASFDSNRLDSEGCSMDKSSQIMPFGSGPRACVGRFLALNEAAITLGELISKYNLETWSNDQPTLDEDNHFNYIGTLRVNSNIRLKLTPRY
jgi:cytochrome P450